MIPDNVGVKIWAGEMSDEAEIMEHLFYNLVSGLITCLVSVSHKGVLFSDNQYLPACTTNTVRHDMHVLIVSVLGDADCH